MEIELKYPPHTPVFFVGASAGGVRALSYLAEKIPPDFPAPLFFVLHRRTHSSDDLYMLPEILTNKAKLEVITPEEGDVVHSGKIYIPPKDRHLTIEDNQVRLLDKPDDHPWRPSIDVTFKSGAREYTKNAISILLTGKLDDGVEGLIETTYQGGITIAQSPEDAYEPVLPLNAILNDHPRYVLPLNDMPQLMCELANHAHFPDQNEILQKAAYAAFDKRSELSD